MVKDPNAERFIQGLRALGYSVNQAEKLIGTPRRTLYRVARGETKVPESALRLLDMYEKFGIPPEHIE